MVVVSLYWLAALSFIFVSAVIAAKSSDRSQGTRGRVLTAGKPSFDCLQLMHGAAIR